MYGELPAGLWFLYVRGEAVHAAATWLSAHPGLHGLASLSLLRVNALLELPLAASAALMAAWVVRPGLPARLLRLGPWLAHCLSWTALFMALDRNLDNPWTRQDLALRLLSAVVVCLAYLTLVHNLGELAFLWPALLAASDGFGLLAGARIAWPDLLMPVRSGHLLGGWVVAVALWPTLALRRSGGHKRRPSLKQAEE